MSISGRQRLYAAVAGAVTRLPDFAAVPKRLLYMALRLATAMPLQSSVVCCLVVSPKCSFLFVVTPRQAFDAPNKRARCSLFRSAVIGHSSASELV